MRDSIGGVYSLAIVFAFIIIISGFLAYTTNYNKAYKMKNKIITILEKYDNDINADHDAPQKEIQAYAKSIGYSADKNYTSKCASTNFTNDSRNVGWCYKITTKNGNGVGETGAGAREDGNYEYTSKYVDIKTFVSIDVPILNTIFPNIRLFTVTGATKQITKVNK